MTHLRPAVVAGYRGWYAADGGGPPLVLLASPFVLARTYRRTARRLGRSFRVYTVQMPGSGAGDRVPPGWGVDDYADWAAGFLDLLGDDNVTLIGHSHTGAVAVAVAARHPRRVGRLVLADSIGAGGPHSLLRVLAGTAADYTLRELPVAAAYWPDLLSNVVRHFRNGLRLTRDSLVVDATADAANVRVPALVAWGRSDDTMPPRCAAEFARRLPDATVYLCTGGAHAWIINRPDEFAEVVVRFAGKPP